MMRTTELALQSRLGGTFAGMRVKAEPLREEVEKVLAEGGEVVLNFQGLEVTQAFIDELVGNLILKQGPSVLERVVFRGCSPTVRAIVEFVAADRADQFLKAH